MNKAEIERLIDKYGRDIYSFCLYLTKSKQDADDLYQDSFLYVIEKKKSFEQESESKTYILSVAVRLWKDKKRKYAWRNRIIEEKYIPLQLVKDEQHSESEAENAVLNSEQNMMIQKCVANLPEKMRVVILLYYMENMQIAEIAEVLHIPTGTVKSRLHKAKSILSKEFHQISG